MVDSTRERAARLAALRDEIARTAGYGSFADMAGPDRQRAEQSALLKLQYEVVAAMLVSGGELVTNELIQLSDAIASTLPAVRAEPLEVVFLDATSVAIEKAMAACAPGDAARKALEIAQSRISELERTNEALMAAGAVPSSQPENGLDHHPTGNGGHPGNVVSLRPPSGPHEPIPENDGTRMASALSAAFPGVPNWTLDGSGRRIDPITGIPTSQRQDK
jgi:hypothetical protein